MGSFMLLIMSMLMARVNRPNMVTMLVWALLLIFLPAIKPKEDPVATVIVLIKVPSNTMHTSYICVIINGRYIK